MSALFHKDSFDTRKRAHEEFFF